MLHFACAIVQSAAFGLSVENIQRDTKRGASSRPDPWTVTGIAIDLDQTFEHGDNPLRADAVVESEGSQRIAKAQANRGANIVRCGDSLLGYLTSRVEDRGDYALPDGAARIADGGHGGRRSQRVPAYAQGCSASSPWAA